MTKHVPTKHEMLGDTPRLDRKLGTRYVPRSFETGEGWGIYDMQRQRFLDDEEAGELTLDEIMYDNVKAAQ